MSPCNAKQIEYERFEILGYKGLFTCYRIDRCTIPKGYYAYDLRDECDGNICELKDHVLVNHWGTCILREKIEGSAEGIDIGTDDYNYLGDCISLEEFMGEKEG